MCRNQPLILNWKIESEAMAGTKRKSGGKQMPPQTKRLRSATKTALTTEAHKTNGVTTSGKSSTNGPVKKQILLNAFDMSTVGHLSPGQWKVRRYKYSRVAH